MAGRAETPRERREREEREFLTPYASMNRSHPTPRAGPAPCPGPTLRANMRAAGFKAPQRQNSALFESTDHAKRTRLNVARSSNASKSTTRSFSKSSRFRLPTTGAVENFRKLRALKGKRPGLPKGRPAFLTRRASAAADVERAPKERGGLVPPVVVPDAETDTQEMKHEKLTMWEIDKSLAESEAILAELQRPLLHDGVDAVADGEEGRRSWKKLLDAVTPKGPIFDGGEFGDTVEIDEEEPVEEVADDKSEMRQGEVDAGREEEVSKTSGRTAQPAPSLKGNSRARALAGPSKQRRKIAISHRGAKKIPAVSKNLRPRKRLHGPPTAASKETAKDEIPTSGVSKNAKEVQQPHKPATTPSKHTAKNEVPCISQNLKEVKPLHAADDNDPSTPPMFTAKADAPQTSTQWASKPAPDAPRTPKIRHRLSRHKVLEAASQLPDLDLRALEPAVPKWSLNDFEILKALGGGQFGDVYLAEEVTRRYRVALKAMDEKNLSENYLWGIAKREIEIQMAMEHPNVIPMYGFFRDRGRVWLIQELAPLGNLHVYMSKFGGRYSEIQAAKFTRDIVRGLRYCHAKGVVHRDLKPENIVLDESRNARLTDFGGGCHLIRHDRRTTRVGTLDFNSPEETGGWAYGKEGDVWSVGVILFEMLYGQPPFEVTGEGGEDITRQRIMEAMIVFPAKPKVSDEAKDLVCRFLKFKPNERIKLYQVLTHPWIIEKTKNLNA